MSKLMAVAFLLLVASSSVNKEKEKDKHTAHFDGLILTVTAIDSTEAKGRKVPVPARSVNPLEPGHVPVSPPPPPPPPPPPLEPGPDHHYLAVFVNVKNAGKNPACMSFSSLLKTTFGLEYKNTPAFLYNLFPSTPRIYEMLPGEESSGSYVFLVKNGVSPLEMFLKRTRKSIHCNESVTGNWGDALLPEQVKFDVHDLPAPNR